MEIIFALNIVCAITSAKWALDLEVSQFRQLIFGLAGVILGPLALLALYVYLLYKARNEGRPAAKWV